MQKALFFKAQALWFAKVGDKDLLISFFATCDSRINFFGRHIIKRTVYSIDYTEIGTDGYKRIATYDHCPGGKCLYEDNINKRYDTTFVIPVLKIKDSMFSKVTESIIADQQKPKG